MEKHFLMLHTSQYQEEAGRTINHAEQNNWNKKENEVKRTREIVGMLTSIEKKKSSVQRAAAEIKKKTKNQWLV